MKTFDNYEIGPCTRTEELDSPGRFYFEVCEPHEADVWTLYGHITGEGVQAIGDFPTRQTAEEIYALITGQTFPGSYRSGDWLRTMYAGHKLLAALRTVVETEYDRDAESRNFDDERLQYFSQLIAQTEGRVA
jgi:hypothetical protein